MPALSPLRVLALLLALCCAAGPVHAQGGPSSAQIAAWIGEDIGLDSAERERLTGVIAWLRESQAELRAEVAAGLLTSGQERERRTQLRAALQARLAVALPPNKAEAVPIERLLAPLAPQALSLGVRTTYFVPAEFDEGPGRFSLLQERAELSFLTPLGPGSALFASASAEATHYEFERARVLDPLRGDPLETTFGASLNLGAQIRIGGAWSLLISGSVGFSVEDGARVDDAITGGTISGVMYELNDAVQLGIGVLVRTQLEDDARVFPIPLIQVRLDLSEDWRLVLGGREGLRLSYTPTPSLELSAGFAIGGAAGTSDTRLDRRGFAPRGVLRSRRFPFEVELTWNPFGPRVLELRASAGVFVYQKLEIDDRRGRSLSDVRTEPMAYGTLGLSWTF